MSPELRPSLIARLARLQEPWSINTAAQIAGLASLADQTYREQTLCTIAEERMFLFDALAALPGVKPYPSAANYLLVELETGYNSAQLANKLLAKGIILRNCANFMGLNDHFFRIAVRLRGENERLLSNIKGALL